MEQTVFYKYDEQTKTLSYYSRKKHGTVAIKLQDMHLSVQKGGNMKTGKEWLLNTLPGESPITAKGKKLTNVDGSCKGCCDGCEQYCYAIKGCRQHHNSVMPSVIKNLILYREDRERFLKELREVLNTWKGDEKVFRWHSSGEIESPQYLEDMMQIASEYPDVHFYSYTKRFEWIKEYLDKHGDFPSNFVWNLSVWRDNLKEASFPEEYLCKVQRFEWDDIKDGELERLKKIPHCPSVALNESKTMGHLDHSPMPSGKERNCRNCGMCWKGKMKGRTIAVYNH